jgi:hypothetical protein
LEGGWILSVLFFSYYYIFLLWSVPLGAHDDLGWWKYPFLFLRMRDRVLMSAGGVGILPLPVPAHGCVRGLAVLTADILNSFEQESKDGFY